MRRAGAIEHALHSAGEPPAVAIDLGNARLAYATRKAEGDANSPACQSRKPPLLLRLQGEVLAAKYHGLRLLTEQARGEDSGLGRLIVKYHGTLLGYRLSCLAVDVLGAAGLAYDAGDEAAETDEATAWHIDNMYDIGLMIGGGSTNIQKNIIGERGLGLPREPVAVRP